MGFFIYFSSSEGRETVEHSTGAGSVYLENKTGMGILARENLWETLVSLYPFHMLESETVVINQHIGGILRELNTSEPSWNAVIPVRP